MSSSRLAVDLAEALTGKAYDTRVAHDAPAALRVAAEFSPDVAFLDLGLPVMDGYDLAAHCVSCPASAASACLPSPATGRNRIAAALATPASMAISSSRWISTRSKPHSSSRRRDGERAGLISEGAPVTGTETHLRF